MQVKQIWELVNDTISQTLGQENLLNEDLSNLVESGNAIFNANALDNYVHTLLNKIGRTIVVNRTYKTNAPSIMRDGWEYGSVLEKIRSELPQVVENETWQLEDKVSYDDHIFYQPKVSVKYFNSLTTFEINLSFTEKQVKQSFHSASEMNAFISMLFTRVENSLTLALDNLIMRTINNFIAETIYNEYKGTDLKSKSTFKAVNLLKLYNDENKTTLTVSDAIKNEDFLKYSIYMISKYSTNMSYMSNLFNIGGKTNFTPKDYQHIVLLDDYAKRIATYLYSTNRHNEFVTIEKHETVPYWQGSGKTYNFTDISSIDVKTSENNNVKVSGILGVIFDKDACMVANNDYRVRSTYTNKAEFYTNYYKQDTSYYNDFDENFVVFFVA